MVEQPRGLSEDAAWAGVELPSDTGRVCALLQDPEGLLRLNPCWTFQQWAMADNGRFTLNVSNQANGQLWETGGQIERSPNRLALQYDCGIKASTRFEIEESERPPRLWIIDDYSRLPASERQQRLAEVDCSLLPWAESIKRHLESWQRWHRIAPWRWYVNGPWRRMTPLGRRVTRLLIWATVGELALFGLLVAVLVAESS